MTGCRVGYRSTLILTPNPGAPGKYQASLLRAFQRTVEEGRFAVVVVDAPNLRVDDIKPYWAAGQARQGRRPPTCTSHDVGRLLSPWLGFNLRW